MTEDWSFVSFDMVNSAGTSRVLSFSSTYLQMIANASAADVELGQAGMRQRSKNQPRSTDAKVLLTQEILKHLLLFDS